MKNFSRTVAAFSLFGAMTLGSSVASATWLGLADGTYDVALANCSSTVISCASLDLQGQLKIAGSGATFMSFNVDGRLFEGDPTEDVLPGPAPLEVYEYATILFSPTAFFFLAQHSIGASALSDFWVYCSNIGGKQVCDPGTTGTWTASLQEYSVSEPGSDGLLALSIVALALVGCPKRLQRRRQTSTTPALIEIADCQFCDPSIVSITSDRVRRPTV